MPTNEPVKTDAGYAGPERRAMPITTTDRALDIVIKYGVGSAVALYLVWVLANLATGGQAKALDAMTATQKLLGDHVKTTDAISDTLRSILVVNRLSCIHQAKDDAARAECARQ